jgi:probable rRNA maturation factor
MNIEPILLQNYDKWQAYQEQLSPSKIKHILEVVFHNIQPNLKNISIELGIILESDQEIQKLNKQFRFKDRPTNVLSFPLHELKPGQDIENISQDDHIYLGDIILAYETFMQEIVLQAKPFINHFTHLLIHSTLHLLGYDHENDEEADIMEALEVEILNCLNIPSPYLI